MRKAAEIVATLRDLERRMRRRARQVEANVPEVVRRVALVASQTLISSTPVDSGRARSNWQVDINGPASDVIDAFNPGEGGSTSAANTQAAINRAASVISSYRAGDTSIHITNNLPYIGRLNEGSSAQATAGFVETAIEQAAVVVRGARVIDD